MAQNATLFRLVPKIKGILIFYSIILVDLAIMLGKNRSSENVLIAEISSHISNFALSSMLMALMSFIMLLQGAPFRFVVWLGMLTILMNFIVEIFVSIMNTPDILDAFYGAIGVLFTGAMMYIFFKVGIRKTV